jgi:hypothetical protein
LSFLLLLGLLLAACLPGPGGSQPPPSNQPTPAPAATAIASPTAAGTATAKATGTPTPTAAATATITPAPEPAGTSEAEEIRLTLGGTSTIISGTLSGHSQKVYLLWVEAGQTLSIHVTSPGVSVLFHLHGRDDGEVYKHLLDGELRWQDRLPVSQYYVLTLDAIGEGDRPYTIDLSLGGAIPG